MFAKHEPAEENPPAIIDFEASGFGAGSYPIEVGLILPDGTSFCSLITPEPEWTHWDDSAEKIHGVSRETLGRFGKPALEVARQLNDYLAGRKVYTDAWYQDFNWLNRLFDVSNLQARFRLHDLRSILSDCEMAAWHQTKGDVLLETQLARHRASNDARILQTTLVKVRSSCACQECIDSHPAMPQQTILSVKD